MLRMMGFTSFISSGAMPLACAFGNSTLMPSVSSGAVIMKMISSTSITSMYGTTLISPMRRRRRPPVCTDAMGKPLSSGPAGVALQDGGELLHEGVVAQLQPADRVGVAVIGDHRGNRREQSDRRGDQCLGDAGGHHRQRRLLHATERHERTHDAPHRAEQADVRTGGTDGGEIGEAFLEPLDFLQLADAHGATRALEQLVRWNSALLEAREFAKAELEDARHSRGAAAALDLPVERGEVA